MTAWLSVITLVLQWAYEAWKGSRAKKNEDDDALAILRAREVEILKAIVAKDSGRLSRLAASRADRLSLLLDSDDVKKDA